MNSQREAFEKQYCENSGITVSEYRKEYVTLPCQCPEEDCPGWAAVRATPLSIKTHVDLYAPDWQAATEQGVGKAEFIGWAGFNTQLDQYVFRSGSEKPAPSRFVEWFPVYTHPPKPTGGGVPDKMTIERAKDFIISNEEIEYFRFAQGFNACREDLLATQQPPEQDAEK